MCSVQAQLRQHIEMVRVEDKLILNPIKMPVQQNQNSADVDIAPALGKIITKLLSHWSVNCREKRCMLVEYVKDNYYARFCNSI